MISFLRACCFIAFCFYTLAIQAQSTEQRVEVTYVKGNTPGEYSFRATNPNPCDYTVKVDVTDLTGLSSSSSLPFVGVVRPGENSLFTLKPSSPNSNGTFRYSYTYLRGRSLRAEPKPFVYLLPVAPGKPCLVQETQYIGTALGLKGDALSNFYSLSIRMEAGDSVFAARRGVITGLIDGITHTQKDAMYVRNVNQVDVFHNDGTFGRYARLKAGSIAVQDGDHVEAGQFLGVVSDELSQKPSLFFTVFYLPLLNAQQQTAYRYAHVRPKFVAQNQESGDMLIPNKTYVAIRPMELVTQEMSKRDIKNYFKK
ncbi:M23 family metallopeptidase [Fibrella aquatica]|uniref:M23 family metallopeptidase n=1 Tax=Fibrella aquatica TaxID=3242487 RepID=UPI0035203556